MPVAVMAVGHMRMGMAQADMGMAMAVRLAGRVLRIVAVPVVQVVDMAVAVGQRRMVVFMHMTLGQMQPDAQRHPGTGANKLARDGVAQQQTGSASGRERECSSVYI